MDEFLTGTGVFHDNRMLIVFLRVIGKAYH